MRGKQIILLFCFLYGTNQRPWDAPYISAATFVNSTTIEVTRAWPANGGGNDIAPSTGILGFGVTGRTVSGAALQPANTIRITVTGFVQGDLVQHNPFPAALDRTKFVVDNTPGLPMPLRPACDVAASQSASAGT